MAKRKATGGVIDAAKYDYDRIKVRDKSGKLRYSAGNGDAVAKAMLLHKASGGSLAGVIRDNGLTAKFKGRDASNEGLMRMSVGVALRALVRHGTPIKIGHLTVKSLKQTIALPKAETVAAKPKKGGKKKSAGKSKPKVRKPRVKRAPAAEAPVEVAPEAGASE